MSRHSPGDKSAASASLVIDLGTTSTYKIGKTATVNGIEALGAGDGAADRFFTGSGNDTITTGSGFLQDFIDTGSGDDRVTLLAGVDFVHMGAGNDTLAINWAGQAGYNTQFGTFSFDSATGYSGFINNNYGASTVPVPDGVGQRAAGTRLIK